MAWMRCVWYNYCLRLVSMRVRVQRPPIVLKYQYWSRPIKSSKPCTIVVSAQMYTWESSILVSTGTSLRSFFSNGMLELAGFSIKVLEQKPKVLSFRTWQQSDGLTNFMTGKTYLLWKLTDGLFFTISLLSCDQWYRPNTIHRIKTAAMPHRARVLLNILESYNKEASYSWSQHSGNSQCWLPIVDTKRMNAYLCWWL